MMVSLGYMRSHLRSSVKEKKKKKKQRDKKIEWRACMPGPPPLRISWLDWVMRDGWSRVFRKKIIDEIRWL